MNIGIKNEMIKFKKDNSELKEFRLDWVPIKMGLEKY